MYALPSNHSKNPITSSLCAGGSDGLIHIIDFQLRSTKQSIEVHSLPITDVTYSNDGFMLLTSSNDCRVKVLSVVNDYSIIYSFSCHLSPVLALCVNQSNFLLACLSGDCLQMCNLATKNIVTTARLVNNADYCDVSVSPGGDALALASSSSNSIEIYSLNKHG